MSTPTFAKTYSLIAYLEKPTESEGFEQIIDFLNGSSVKYSLTVSFTIHTSCIKQFWTSAKVNKVNNEVQIQALVNGKRVNIKESSIRCIMRLDHDEGASCLTNTEIFEGLARMGYEKPSDKLTFYKAFFFLQWKFLIHSILQCLIAKTTSWNEFSSTMASAIIYLATNQKFNFSSGHFKIVQKSMISMRSSSDFDSQFILTDKEIDNLNQLINKLHGSSPKEKVQRSEGKEKREAIKNLFPLGS
nr:hypothetical protein [Tanacetum cinerariifolium]